MPGLNIIYRPKGITPERREQIISDLSEVRTKPASDLQTIYDDFNVIVSHISYYDSYPFRRFKINNCHIFLEGYIFSHCDGDPITKLLDLANTFNSSTLTSEKKVGDFVKAVDGEFLVVLYDDKTGDLAIFNDILGRLPVYFCKREDILYISREVKFITAMVKNLTLSAHSLAQSLVFLFPIGDRTLFTDIKKMLPASLLILKNGDNYLRHYTLFDWNFSVNKINEPARMVADELVALYLEGIGSRARIFGEFENILALSGGLDSRTVMAGLMKVGEPFTAITLIDHRGLLSNDLAVTKEIASIYNFDLNIFELPGMDLNSMNQLIRMKDGLCVNAIMGTALYAHEIISKQYGSKIAYYTGAGGGLVLAPRCPIRSVELNTLSHKIINRNSQALTEDAAAIMRIDPDEFRNRLNAYFLDYPEETPKDKYGHFMIFEHLFNFSFEGDDRQRFYFWNSAPFYSAAFFQKAMQISDISKMNHRLFADFLKRLDPNMASIKYANWGFPITSPLTPYYLKAKNWLLEKPKLAGMIRKIRAYKQLSSVKGRIPIKDQDIIILKNNIRKMISEHPELNEHVATDQITRLLPKWNNLYILYGINNLLTYIGILKDSTSSLRIDSDH